MIRCGRNHGPRIVADLWAANLLEPDWLPPLVAGAWSMAEWPGRALDPDEWRELWAWAGFCVDGARAPRRRPCRPRTLYWGAVPEYAAGWSWTPDPGLARWFADQPHNSGQGRVYTATVEPHRVLAMFSGTGLACRRGEVEVVVDTGGLTITGARHLSGPDLGEQIGPGADGAPQLLRHDHHAPAHRRFDADAWLAAAKRATRGDRAAHLLAGALADQSGRIGRVGMWPADLAGCCALPVTTVADCLAAFAAAGLLGRDGDGVLVLVVPGGGR